jgi:hypothetical protein
MPIPFAMRQVETLSFEKDMDFVQFLASGAQATYPYVEPPPANDLSSPDFSIAPGPVPLLPNPFVD